MTVSRRRKKRLEIVEMLLGTELLLSKFPSRRAQQMATLENIGELHRFRQKRPRLAEAESMGAAPGEKRVSLRRISYSAARTP